MLEECTNTEIELATYELFESQERFKELYIKSIAVDRQLQQVVVVYGLDEGDSKYYFDFEEIDPFIKIKEEFDNREEEQEDN